MVLGWAGGGAGGVGRGGGGGEVGKMVLMSADFLAPRAALKHC